MFQIKAGNIYSKSINNKYVCACDVKSCLNLGKPFSRGEEIIPFVAWVCPPLFHLFICLMCEFDRVLSTSVSHACDVNYKIRVDARSRCSINIRCEAGLLMCARRRFVKQIIREEAEPGRKGSYTREWRPHWHRRGVWKIIDHQKTSNLFAWETKR